MIRKQRVGALATVALVLVGLVDILSPAHALTNCTVSAAELAIDTEEQDFIRRLNDYRTANGLNTVTLDTSVTRAATWFAVDMATKNYFPPDHVDSLGRDPATRLNQCDVGWTTFNESLAAGNSTGAATFLQWRNSPAHNTNMLQANVSLAGVGRAFNAAAVHGWYWTLNLTAPAPVAPTSTSTSTSTTLAPTSTSTSTSTTLAPTSTSTSSRITVPSSGTGVTPVSIDEMIRAAVCPPLLQLAANPDFEPFLAPLLGSFGCSGVVAPSSGTGVTPVSIDEMIRAAVCPPLLQLPANPDFEPFLAPLLGSFGCSGVVA